MNWTAKFFPPQNPRTTIPPGEFRPRSDGLPNILVVSVPRSGTHACIDLILNNLPAYCQSPLYVELDQLLDQPEVLQELLASGGYVLKTHFPMTPGVNFREQDTETFRRFAEHSVLVQVHRPSDPAVASARTMWPDLVEADFRQGIRSLEEFWSEQDVLSVSMSEMLGADTMPVFLDQVAERCGTLRSPKLSVLPSKHARYWIYACKLSSRLFGSRSLLPVCTGIQLGRSRS